MSVINLDFANSLKLILPETREISIVLVGCGGTGSWLAPAVVRVGKIVAEQQRKEVHLVFVDPDVVEEKNIYRQNFCAAEIGKNKAMALAERYGTAWGMEVLAISRKFSRALVDNTSLMVIIGCVDGAEGRKAILDTVHEGVVWLDCGNARNYGQVLCGVSGRKTALPGLCGMLPMPSEVHPELVVEEGEIASTCNERRSRNDISCSEIAMQESQGLAINQRMAAEAADYLVRMLITKDLRKYATYIDLESGTTQSKYISASGKERK